MSQIEISYVERGRERVGINRLGIFSKMRLINADNISKGVSWHLSLLMNIFS